MQNVFMAGHEVKGSLGALPHLVQVPAVKSELDDLAVRNPKAKDADARRFFDDSFVRQMQASGFIDSLYK